MVPRELDLHCMTYSILSKSVHLGPPRSSQQCVCGRFKLEETPDLLMTTDVVHVILKSMFICSAFMLIIVYIHKILQNKSLYNHD